MSSQLGARLVPGSVDASLAELDARIKEPNILHNASFDIGPFSVFSLSDSPTPHQLTAATHGQEIEPPLDLVTASISELDSLLNVGNALGWNDLFDSGLDFTSPSQGNQFDEDPLTRLARVASQPIDTQYEAQSSELTTVDAMEPVNFEVENLAPPPYAPVDMTDMKILSHGQILLRYFKDVIIPTYSPLPVDSKSPWEIMNCYAAIQRLADMTYLEVPDVKHASRANLFGALACSAYTISETQTHLTALPVTACQQIVNSASARAREHMQKSLRTETHGTKKARYKDQLMAVNTMIALATLMENHHDARCYLIDAERLLRLRGLAKRILSRRARLLHHVYTWLRIVGESTFIMHDYASSALPPRIENSLVRSRNTSDRAPDEADPPANNYGQLDNFLRVDPHETDSEPDLQEHKEQEAGIRNIHLQDMRQWSGTLYLQIYSIPETWLSLVSQTTRLANVIDTMNASKSEMTHSFNAYLRNKSARLEAMICSLASETSGFHLHDSHSSGNGGSGIRTVRPPSEAMLRALNSALVIFFYRRIRDVHPWILQVHVNEVIEALNDFDCGMAQYPKYRCGTIGTPWPAFMAGCEAMTTSKRNWIVSWLEKSSKKLLTAGHRSCIDIMREVWHRRDAAMATHNAEKHECNNRTPSRKKADMKCTWIHVLRDKKYWPMLY
ncbi:MAG: hypothetical protein Q9193_003015 [Seirophora villosa]